MKTSTHTLAYAILSPLGRRAWQKGAAFLLLTLFTSCYRLFSSSAPQRVDAGQTFEVTFTVVDDGSSTQNFVTDWSYAGIRLPEGWTVTMPRGAHQQFAESWVYYSDGSKVNSSHNMVPSAKLTDFYNAACRKTGYKWHGFQSEKRIPKNISACWRNGCDSIRLTFHVTVPQEAKAGKYQIDFIGGDEEDEQGVDKYASYTDAKGSRLFHVGTVSNSYVENRNTALALTVEVTDYETALRAVPSSSSLSSDPSTASPRYDLSGRPLSGKPSKGLYVQRGKKTAVR